MGRVLLHLYECFIGMWGGCHHIVATIILQMIVMEVPVLSRFLQTYDVPNLHLVVLFVISLPIIFIMEMYKFTKKHKNK